MSPSRNLGVTNVVVRLIRRVERKIQDVFLGVEELQAGLKCAGGYPGGAPRGRSEAICRPVRSPASSTSSLG